MRENVKNLSVSIYISPDKFSSEKIFNWTIGCLTRSNISVFFICYSRCRRLICLYIVRYYDLITFDTTTLGYLNPIADKLKELLINLSNLVLTYHPKTKV